VTVPQQNVPLQGWVLKLSVVQAAILQLESRPIHETLPAYLHLRRQAESLGRFSDLQPRWQHEPAEWMDVPGGPPGKPYFRPFTSRGGSKNGYWLNKNLAGSYAKRSLRNQGETYIDQASDAFALPISTAGQPDPELILARVFLGNPLPVWAIASFIFRNRLFELTSAAMEQGQAHSEPTWKDINQVFFGYFGFTPVEISALFTLDNPLNDPCEEWKDA